LPAKILRRNKMIDFFIEIVDETFAACPSARKNHRRNKSGSPRS